MFLSGIGFTNRLFYFTLQFLESKTVARLLFAPIKAREPNEYTLARTLDETSKQGATTLFGAGGF